MKLALGILALSLTGCVRRWGTQPVPPPTPQQLMARSVKECSVFNQGNPECVRLQYEANMRAYYYEGYRLEGPPGIPGRMPTPDPRHMAYHYPEPK